MRRVRSAWRVLLVWLLLAAGPAWQCAVDAQQPPPSPKPAAGRVRADRPAAARRAAARGAAAHRRVFGGLARRGRLPLLDLAAARPRRSRYRRSGPPPASNMTAAHFLFIPAVLVIGIVIGWILGSRAAQDAFAAELRSGEKSESGAETASPTRISPESLNPEAREFRRSGSEDATSRSRELLACWKSALSAESRSRAIGAGLVDSIHRPIASLFARL